MQNEIHYLDKEQGKNDYKLQLDSDIGEVYIKDYSKMYMDEHMTLSLDPRLGVFTLESPSGEGHPLHSDLVQSAEW